MKLVRSFLCIGHLYPQKIFLVLISVKGWVKLGSIMSMKNSIDTIWNQTNDLQACSPVPRPTAFACFHWRIAVKLIWTVACYMYFIGHQRSRGWRFCNLLAVLLFSVWDVKNMCQYLLIGYITELGITKEPLAATRNPVLTFMWPCIVNVFF